MIAALKGRGLIYRTIWLFAFVPMFIPTFMYELAMFMLGRRRYSKRQYVCEFDHGYSPLTYGRQETSPRHPDVWDHALDRTYEEFGTDLRLATLMGIIYRFRQPETIEEFDRTLSEHVASLRREPDPPGMIAGTRLWNPANIVGFMDEYCKKQGFGNFTHYYIRDAGKANEWRILKLGAAEFKPEQHSRSISYYEEYFRTTPVQHVEYSFSGDRTSIRNVTFNKSADAALAGKVVSVLCDFAVSFISAMFDERDAAVIIPKLDVSAPQPFECVVQSARIKLEWLVSRPYWSEPDQVLASLTIEKI